MRRPSVLIAAATLALSAAVGVTASSARTTAESPWTLYPSPGSDAEGVLADVAAAGPAKAWAVGGSLLMRWTGSAWVKVDLGSLVPTSGRLDKVHATSGSVWVIGANSSGDPFILRARDGVWKKFPYTGMAGLHPTAISATKGGIPVLAAAIRGEDSGVYVAKWNGTSWNPQRLPGPGPAHSLAQIITELRLIPGTEDRFVGVGEVQQVDRNELYVVRGRPGIGWQEISPNLGNANVEGFDVAPTSAGDLTVFGRSGYLAALYVTRFYAGTWHKQVVPTVSGDVFSSLAVQPGKSRLLVGSHGNRAIALEYLPGTGWHRLAALPSPSHLNAVGAIPGSSAYWAVGDRGGSALIARH